MFGFLRIDRVSAFLVVAFLFTSFAEESSAQQLAEFLFWDSMGNAIGQAAQANADYRAERQLWKDKIAAAKAELERCGGCASAQAELGKWQGIENRWQEFAGGVAQAVGMPPALAKWLDIDLPLTSGPTPQQLEERKVIRGAWVDDLPEVYQRVVDTHLDCLRSYQSKHGLLSNLAGANSPGGPCYDTGKLRNYIAAGDYQAFDREKIVQKARAAGKIIPEYVNEGPTSTVYYGQVRDDFIPRLPPTDVILSKLSEEKTREVRYVMFKAGNGQLTGLGFENFFWTRIAPEVRCFSGNASQAEVERRVCDDLSELNWTYKPQVLLCYYTRQGGTKTIIQDGALYWYAERPQAADPARLLERSASHPVLQIGDPRTGCPATKGEADGVDTEYRARIASLRSQTPQAPTSVTLPKESETKRDERARRKIAAFPIEGRYTTNVIRNYRRVRQSSCTIKEVRDNWFEAICNDQKSQYGGIGIVENGQFIVDFKGGKIAFTPAGNALLGSNASGTVTLKMIRLGDIRQVVSSGAKDTTAPAEPEAAPGKGQDTASLSRTDARAREQAEKAAFQQRLDAAARARKQAEQVALKQRQEAQAEAREQAKQVAIRQRAEAQARLQAEKLAIKQREQDEANVRLAAIRERLNDADIVGIRLGITLADAETIVRNRLDVAAFLEAKSATPFRPFEEFRAFHNRDQSESIVLFKESAASDKLIAVLRIVAIPAGLDSEQIMLRLKEKYGQNPQQSSKRRGLWSASENWKRCLVGIGQTKNLRYLKVVQISKGPQPYTPTLKVLGYRYRRGQLPPAGTWDGCGPTVQYDIWSSRIRIILYNLAQYGPYILEAVKAAGPGGTKSSKIDF